METDRGFCIAAAQSASVPGDLQANVANHHRIALLAAERGANLIVFPELSLSGYEPELAQSIAIEEHDPVLGPLRQLCKERLIVIIAGAPIRSHADKPYIGAVIFGAVPTIYRKRHVTPSESRYFTAGVESCVVRSGDVRVGVAICADLDHAEHAASVKLLGATIYAAGVMMTPDALQDAHMKMAKYSARHSMLSVMANHATASGGFATGGRSAVWDALGNCAAMAGGGGEALVLAERTPGRLNTEVFAI